MKRRDVLKKLFGGIAAIAAISATTSLISENHIEAETDDDKLDSLVKAGDFIQDKTFFIKRPHHFNGKPCYINRCMFYSPNESYVYANPGSVITNSLFDKCGYRHKMTKSC